MDEIRSNHPNAKWLAEGFASRLSALSLEATRRGWRRGALADQQFGWASQEQRDGPYIWVVRLDAGDSENMPWLIKDPATPSRRIRAADEVDALERALSAQAPTDARRLGWRRSVTGAGTWTLADGNLACQADGWFDESMELFLFRGSPEDVLRVALDRWLERRTRMASVEIPAAVDVRASPGSIPSIPDGSDGSFKIGGLRYFERNGKITIRIDDVLGRSWLSQDLTAEEARYMATHLSQMAGVLGNEGGDRAERLEDPLRAAILTVMDAIDRYRADRAESSEVRAAILTAGQRLGLVHAHLAQKAGGDVDPVRVLDAILDVDPEDVTDADRAAADRVADEVLGPTRHQLARDVILKLSRALADASGHDLEGLAVMSSELRAWVDLGGV